MSRRRRKKRRKRKMVRREAVEQKEAEASNKGAADVIKRRIRLMKDRCLVFGRKGMFFFASWKGCRAL
jgi:hypothetical protein